MNIPTTISKIQLYRNGAVVTRTGRLSLKAGRSDVMIKGLTHRQQADSLRLAFPAGVALEDIRIIENETQDSSEQLARELDRVDRRIESLQIEMDLLKQNCDFTKRSEMGLEAMETYLSTLPDKIDQLFQKVQALQDTRKALQKQYDKQLRQDNLPLIQASLAADQEIECPFTLSYREVRAGWTPVYELHFAGESEPLTIRQRARLVQHTDEDWTTDELTLFTGNPQLSNEIPELLKQRISLSSPISPWGEPVMYAMAPQVSNTSMHLGKAKRAAADMGDTEELPVLYDADTAPVEAQAQDTMTSFVLSGTRTIPAGMDGSLADLKTYQVPASYQITAVPSKSSTAWLTARIKGSDWPLQQIDASLYLRGVYGGHVHISPDTTEEDFLLSLGRDDRVQVRRDKQLDRKQDQLFKKRTVQHLSYEIRILSQLPQTAALEVLDRIPVPDTKEIQVEPIELSGAVIQAETGRITWKASLEPGQTLTRTLTYDISWPRGQKVYQSDDPGFQSIPSPQGSNYCPVCGFLVPDASRFCPQCGNVM